jgi:hypothetical protein
MKTKSVAVLAAIAVSVLLTVNVQAGIVRLQDDADQDFVPTGKGWGVPHIQKKGAHKGSARTRTKTNGINYHGGPVLLGTTNVYYIWYGNWSGNSAINILNNLALSLGGSPYYNINTTYYDASNRKVSNAVAAPASMTDSYSRGAAISDNDVQTIVTNSIASGSLPKDPNGVYVVLTSADVNETSGFCTQYCGWHAHANLLGFDAKFAFVGNADRCPSACSGQTAGSPNGNVGADAMASTIAHEVEEVVTDPDLNGWYDTRGYENADKCAWKFGTTYKTANGSLANMNLGGMNYLIQQNWLNAGGGKCVSSY